jgi:hypothetical protein
MSAGLVVSGSVLPAAAQTRQQTLLVTAVEKSGGEPVEALTPGDVVVREDGVAREILKVTRANDPVLLVLIVDNSQAARRAMQDMRLALTTFVETFAGPHELAVIGIADRPTVLSGPTTSKAQLTRAVESVFAQPGAGAYLLEAVLEQSKAIQKRETGRAAIIAITSQGAEFSDRPPQVVMEAIGASGATFHVVELQDTDQAPPLNQGVRDRNVVLDRGTSETGGEREIVLANLGLRDVLQKVGRIATTQHEVVYGRPDTLIPPRRVTVSSSKPTLEVRGNVLRTNQEAR